MRKRRDRKIDSERHDPFDRKGAGVHAWLDDFLHRQNEIIDRVGWAVMPILPTDDDLDTVTPYAYSVGLTAKIAPEFVITGLPPEIAQQLLNDMAGRVFHGAGPVAHGTRVAT